MNFLRERDVLPTMPAGVHLVSWNLREPHVAIEVCSLVTDTALFARTTLEQLQAALDTPQVLFLLQHAAPPRLWLGIGQRVGKQPQTEPRLERGAKILGSCAPNGFCLSLLPYSDFSGACRISILVVEATFSISLTND